MEKLDKKSFLILFGNNLRNAREAKGYTQQQLADELGIEISQISRIERGVINTTVATLFAICKVLQISSADLM